MRWREQIREFYEFPGTTILTLIWVGVYVASLIYQGTFTLDFRWNVLMGLGGIDTVTGHVFGDARAIDFYDHEWWRAVTSSVFHYSFLHILLNLFGLIQLGRLVESWYGTGPFLLISVIIGGLGNLIAGYVRPMMGGDPLIHCAGGSTLVMGLVGLCAVVGWRSRTRIGRSLQGQMVGVLVLTAILGVLIPIIDNYGHAFGAMIGGLIGFFHRQLFEIRPRGLRNMLGVIGLGILVACGVLQYWSHIHEVETNTFDIASSTTTLKALERAQLCYLQETLERSQLGRHFQKGEFVPALKPLGTPNPELRSPWKIRFAAILPEMEKACAALADSPEDPVAARAIELFREAAQQPVTIGGYVAFLEPTNVLMQRGRNKLETTIARARGR